jgi:hypothetical protein
MVEPIYRRWSPPVPTEVEDLHGWLVDLHAAKDMFERQTSLLDNERSDPLLVDALSTSALVRYGRCFTSGIRKRLGLDLLPNATAAELDLHERMRGVRDWHVAHAVNRQEAHGLYIIVNPDPSGQPTVLGISSQSTAALPLDPPEVTAAAELCRRWVVALEERLVAENLRLRPYLDELTRPQLLAMPSQEPSTDANIKSRRRQRSE